MLEEDEDGPRGETVALLVNAVPDQVSGLAQLLRSRQAEMLVCNADPKVAAAATVPLLDEGAEAASERLDPGVLADWRSALERAQAAFGPANLCIVWDTPVGLLGERYTDMLAGFRLFLGGAWRSSKQHALFLLGAEGSPVAALDTVLHDLKAGSLPVNVSLQAFGPDDPKAEAALRALLDER